jgi:hypothetical protein
MDRAKGNSNKPPKERAPVPHGSSAQILKSNVNSVLAANSTKASASKAELIAAAWRTRQKASDDHAGNQRASRTDQETQVLEKGDLTIRPTSHLKRILQCSTGRPHYDHGYGRGEPRLWFTCDLLLWPIYPSPLRKQLFYYPRQNSIEHRRTTRSSAMHIPGERSSGHWETT